MNPLNKVEVRRLRAYYGQNPGIRDVDLDIPERHVLAVIGPSGCGKSTFLRCLNRMHELLPGGRVEGSVRVDGSDIYAPEADPVEVRRAIGMVFQRPNPFPTMSIFANVAAGLVFDGVRQRASLAEAVERSLRSAWLWDEVKDRLHKPATGLSGGQQQRLCIARALAVEPEVLLMDEPTSALDPRSAARVEELVGELRTQLTIIIVTHSMQQAARVSDLTAFFLVGDLVEHGPTARIFTNPVDRRTEDYITGRFG